MKLIITNHFLLLLLLLALVTVVFGQACVANTDVPTLCKPFVRYPLVYVPQNQTFQDLLNTSAIPLRLIAAIPAPCNGYLLKFICASVYQNCTLVNTTSNTVAITSPVCSSLCQNTRDNCPSMYTSPPAFPADCFTPPFANSTITNTAVPSSNQTVDIQCTDTSAIPVNITARCTFPLAPTPDPSSCAPQCPIPVYKEKFMKGVYKMQRGITGAGTVLGFLAVLILFLRPRRALHHTTSPPMMFCLVALAINLTVLFGTAGKHSGCRNKYTAATWHDEKCAVQGAFFVYWGMAITTWWTLVVFNIVLVVFSVPQLPPRMMNVAYHIYAWGVPALITIVALGRKGISSVPGGGPCFLDFTIGNGWFADGIFYFPIGIVTELMLICLGVVGWRLRSSWSQSGQTRLLLFGICYNLLGNYNLSYRIYTRHFSKRIEHSLMNWFLCSFREAIAGRDPSAACQPEFLLSYPAFVILTICVFLLPFLGLVFFVCTQENWQVFKAKVLLRDESTHTRSGSSRYTNSGN